MRPTTRIVNDLRIWLFTGFLVLAKVHSLAGQSANLRINEFLAVNVNGLTDVFGEHSDWIEIYNPTAQAITLSGWAITDDVKEPEKWLFPDFKIDKYSYLVVFASGRDRKIQGEKFHTNFKLSGTGEYLALVDPAGNTVSAFAPSYPAQLTDISYGFQSGTYTSFSQPTPGAANSQSVGIIPSSPVFSRGHGFYASSFTLEISSNDTGTEIYYTLNGSKPSKTKGIKYSGPVSISKTTIVRAISYKGETPSAKISTVTYLFPDDIIHQSNSPSGYPVTWGPYTGITGTAPADYEMDPELVASPGFETKLKSALLSIPTISIVTDRNYLFSKSQSADSGGIYIYTGPPLTNITNGTGWGWERPASFEFFDHSDSISLQVDCALQIHGGHSRRPEKSPKHSFRLEFKEEFGPPRLEFPIFGAGAAGELNAIVLRAGFNNSWLHHTESERKRAQFIQDIWAKDTQGDMGYPASHGFYAHLYLNGLYWGIYSPSEKIDADFMEAYLGGDVADYDVIKDYGEVADGDPAAWTKLLQMANAGLTDNDAYQRIQGNFPDGTRNGAIEPMVDIVNLADYMIINFYNGNNDWDHHNWIAARNRNNPGKGFRFFCWDEEKTLENKNANILNENNPDCPSRIFQQLLKNVEFKRLFADRIQKHCFGSGALTPESGLERWNRRSTIVEKAVDAEAARWGDYRRDVHRWQTAGPFSLYTKENSWIPEHDNMIYDFFPQRTDIFLIQLRAAGLFPNTLAPEILLNSTLPQGNFININDTLTIQSAGGTIYYTTDGSDPVAWNAIALPGPNAKLYSDKIILKGSAKIRARCIDNGEWSAATEYIFILKSDYKNLKITEINYHPGDKGITDESEIEFIELKNTGNSMLILGGCTLTEAIDFQFEPGFILGPGDFAVLGSATKGFFAEYAFVADGIYDGQLDNSGERIVLQSPMGDTLISMSYSDMSAWPVSADGDGKTLVPMDLDPEDQAGDPSAWRASYHYGGSPGRDDVLEIGRLENGMSTDNFTLYQNFPNPFSDRTAIPFSLTEESSIDLTVFDRNGHPVVTIEKGNKAPGEYLAEWDGTSVNGVEVPAGVYFIRLTVTANGLVKSGTRTVIRLR